MVAAIPHFACTSLDVSYYCTDHPPPLSPLPPNPKHKKPLFSPQPQVYILENSCVCLLSILSSRYYTRSINFVFFVLSNNAGVMATPFMLSKDNIELQFATNHLGTLHLSQNIFC